MMMRAAIICPDRELGERLQGSLNVLRRVAVLRKLDSYPSPAELSRFLRAAAPEVIFLSVESRDIALQTAQRIEQEAPGIQIIAISRTCDANILLETMRAGIREFLYPPFESRTLDAALDRLQSALDQNPPAIDATDALYAFLPAKAGSGTTTIAVNTALALASLPENETLLLDLDLNSGLVGFMILLQSQFSIVDAAENALEMDENLWAKLVTKSGKLDAIPVGKLTPGYRIENTQIRHILDFARRNYKSICVDLSGMMERYSIEVLHEAKRVFLVCTPELPSLHLAREKLSYLREQDLSGKVSILLNRAQKRHQISIEEMESLFGLPIHTAFPNDYTGVHRALTAGKPVDPGSELGRKYRELAESLIPKPQVAPEAKKRTSLFGQLLPKLAPR